MDSGGYYVEIACPACGGSIEVDAAGVDVTCPHCGAVLHRRKPRSAPDLSAVPSGAARQPGQKRISERPVAQQTTEQARPQRTSEQPADRRLTGQPAAQQPSSAQAKSSSELLSDPEAVERARVPVCDARGRALVRAIMPSGWRYVAGTDSTLASEAFPFAVRVEMREGEKLIRYHSSRTFAVRRGSNMPEFPDVELPDDQPFLHPSAWMDAKAVEAVGADAPTLAFDESLDFSESNAKITAEIRKGFEEEIERSNENARKMAFDGVGVQSHINGCCQQTITRLYRFEHAGRPYRLAVHVRVFVKNYTMVMPRPQFGLGAVGGGFAGTGGAFGGLGSALGGMAQQSGQQAGTGFFRLGAPFGPQQAGRSAQASPFGSFLGSMVDRGLVGGMIGERVREQRQQAQASQAPAAQGGGYGTAGEASAIVPEAWQDPQAQPGWQNPQAGPTAAASLEAALASPDPDLRIPAVVDAGKGEPGNQIIECCLMHFSTFAAPADEFQEVFEGTYSQFVYSEMLDEGLMSEVKQWRARVNEEKNARFQARLATQRQISESMAAATRAQCDAALAQNDAMLARARATNASIDARNEQFRAGVSQRMAESNASHQAFRARQAAQFGGTPTGGYGGYGSAPSYSGSMSSAERFSQEAILGQSTYVDQYGDEHTISAQADRAWIDRAGNTIGTDSWVDPGSDWTEMTRL